MPQSPSENTRTHHADTTVTSTWTTACPYVDIWKTLKHTSHTRVRYKREKMSTSHMRSTLSYASYTLFTYLPLCNFSFYSSCSRIIELDMRNIPACGDTHAHTRNQTRTSIITVIPELALFLSGPIRAPRQSTNRLCILSNAEEEWIMMILKMKIL